MLAFNLSTHTTRTMKVLQPNASRDVQKPKTKEQLAKEMDIHLRTFQRRLEKAGMSVPRGLIFPEQQAEIFERLGWERKVS